MRFTRGYVTPQSRARGNRIGFRTREVSHDQIYLTISWSPSLFYWLFPAEDM